MHGQFRSNAIVAVLTLVLGIPVTTQADTRPRLLKDATSLAHGRWVIAIWETAASNRSSNARSGVELLRKKGHDISLQFLRDSRFAVSITLPSGKQKLIGSTKYELHAKNSSRLDVGVNVHMRFVDTGTVRLVIEDVVLVFVRPDDRRALRPFDHDAYDRLCSSIEQMLIPDLTRYDWANIDPTIVRKLIGDRRIALIHVETAAILGDVAGFQLYAHQNRVLFMVDDRMRNAARE